ncbi:hypothetical protein COJ27_29950 [Bacillus cereus]|nr:hypothetical protein COJ27_29950 [Bacillus cereus]
MISYQSDQYSVPAKYQRKTHLATSIGITAAKKCTSTYFIKCHDLLQNLKRANTVISVGGKSYRIKDHFNKENE